MRRLAHCVDGQIGHHGSEVHAAKWESAANSTQSLGRYAWAGLAKKTGATGRLARHLVAGRPIEAGQRQACSASTAFVAEGNILEDMTLVPSLKGCLYGSHLSLESPGTGQGPATEFRHQNTSPWRPHNRAGGCRWGVGPGPARVEGASLPRQGGRESLASVSRATFRRPAVGLTGLWSITARLSWGPSPISAGACCTD